jgi:two-component system cell cycle sensor histidine kinase/response regulator CckA
VELGVDVLQGLTRIDDLFRQQMCPFPVDLGDHLKAGLLQSVLGKGIGLHLDQDAVPWLVPGPSKCIWQVIINLVGNARQAMPDEGRLEVVSRRVYLSEIEASRHAHQFVAGTPQAGEFIVLSIRDTGSGIPRDALPRIFDLFYSGRKSSGYGLAVTRKIIEDMGGFLGVDSKTEGPDRGTVFTIYFPRAL